MSPSFPPIRDGVRGSRRRLGGSGGWSPSACAPLLSGARRSAIWIKGPSTPGKAAIAGWIQCVEEAQIIRGNPRSLPHMRDESPHTPSGHAVLRDVFSIVTEI